MKTIRKLCLMELMDYIEEELRVNGIREIHEDGLGILENARQAQKLLAVDGSLKAREFMQNSIYFLLIEKTDMITEDNIDELLGEYHVDYYRNIYTGNDDGCLSKPIDSEISRYLSRYSISREDDFDVKLQKLTQ